MGDCSKGNRFLPFQEGWNQLCCLTVCHSDSNNPFKDLQEYLNELKSTDPSMMPEDVTSESIVSSDDDVIATAPEIAESDIIEELCISQKQKLKKKRTTMTIEIQLMNFSIKAKKIP